MSRSWIFCRCGMKTVDMSVHIATANHLLRIQNALWAETEAQGWLRPGRFWETITRVVPQLAVKKATVVSSDTMRTEEIWYPDWVVFIASARGIWPDAEHRRQLLEVALTDMETRAACLARIRLTRAA